MADFYPSREDELIAWHSAFAAAVASYAAALGLPAATVTQVGVDAGTVSDALTFNEAAANFAAEVVQWKNQVLRGELNTPNPPLPNLPTVPALALTWLANIEDRTRQLAAQIKANSAYTAQMGADMGIISSPSAPGQVSVSAQALTQSQVAISVFKAGYDVVAVDSRRGGGWEQIALLTTANYVDGRAPLVAGQPELREYRCQAYENNQRVGALSGVVSVVTVP